MRTMTKGIIVLTMLLACIQNGLKGQQLPASGRILGEISDDVMKQIYDEVKTPYKQGVVIKTHGEGQMVDCPSVFRVDGQWCMTYVMYDGRGYETWIAKSEGLVHWTEWKGEPLVYPTEDYESKYAHKAFVVKHNGVVYHYYCAVTKSGERTIALATSKPIYSHYLFAYFTGNETDQQQVCYAISDNGLDFTPLNSGCPVIAADSIIVSGGVRDPHILRSDDGWFRMVVTDMDWAQGGGCDA